MNPCCCICCSEESPAGGRLGRFYPLLMSFLPFINIAIGSAFDRFQLRLATNLALLEDFSLFLYHSQLGVSTNLKKFGASFSLDIFLHSKGLLHIEQLQNSKACLINHQAFFTLSARTILMSLSNFAVAAPSAQLCEPGCHSIFGLCAFGYRFVGSGYFMNVRISTFFVLFFGSILSQMHRWGRSELTLSVAKPRKLEIFAENLTRIFNRNSKLILDLMLFLFSEERFGSYQLIIDS